MLLEASAIGQSFLGLAGIAGFAIYALRQAGKNGDLRERIAQAAAEKTQAEFALEECQTNLKAEVARNAILLKHLSASVARGGISEPGPLLDELLEVWASRARRDTNRDGVQAAAVPSANASADSGFAGSEAVPNEFAKSELSDTDPQTPSALFAKAQATRRVGPIE